jgi:AAA+ superfamily predicted ATPase
MKDLVMDGDRSFALGNSRVKLRVERIANHRASGASAALSLRLYALEPAATGPGLAGHVVAIADLPPLPAGAEQRGFEITVAARNVPPGYYLPAITLAEKSESSPNGWAIFDICRFDEELFFGKRLTIESATCRASGARLEVTLNGLRNQTREPTGRLRAVVFLTPAPYESGPVTAGVKLGQVELTALGPGSVHEASRWSFDRPAAADGNGFAVVFVQEVDGEARGTHVVMPVESATRPTVSVEGDPWTELDALIGLAAVKTKLREMGNLAEWLAKLKQHGRTPKDEQTLHLCFTGSPGTGKTTVARIVGRVFAKHGLLPSDNFLEVTRADLVGGYIGQTEKKTKEVVEKALGGVLFIDEAYSLSEPRAGGSGQDYGSTAIAELVPAMENLRGQLCVVVAGYTEEMRDFLDVNPGMASRIASTIEFPDYTESELWQIFERMLARNELRCEAGLDADFCAYMQQLRASRKPGHFGNAREVRNVVEQACQALATRTRSTPDINELLTLRRVDFKFFAPPDGQVGAGPARGAAVEARSLSNDELVRLFESATLADKRAWLGRILPQQFGGMVSPDLIATMLGFETLEGDLTALDAIALGLVHGGRSRQAAELGSASRQLLLRALDRGEQVTPSLLMVSRRIFSNLARALQQLGEPAVARAYVEEALARLPFKDEALADLHGSICESLLDEQNYVRCREFLAMHPKLTDYDLPSLRAVRERLAKTGSGDELPQPFDEAQLKARGVRQVAELLGQLTSHGNADLAKLLQDEIVGATSASLDPYSAFDKFASLALETTAPVRSRTNKRCEHVRCSPTRLSNMRSTAEGARRRSSVRWF